MYNFRDTDPSQLEFVSVASVDELKEGERILVEIDGTAIAIFHIDKELYAISDLCSHDDGPVAEGEIDGKQILCPRHGAAFDLETGKALSFPAVVDISSYPVKIVGNDVQVGLPFHD